LAQAPLVSWQSSFPEGKQSGCEIRSASGRDCGQTFPCGTLAVNVTGSFIIGLFAALTDPEGRWLVSPSLRQFFMIGVCGGYTTFSSFSLQTLTLAQDGQWFWAMTNSIASFVFCLVAVWLGHFLVMLINKP
jgi:fluoride exporter